jgi:hypothetical protein
LEPNMDFAMGQSPGKGRTPASPASVDALGDSSRRRILRQTTEVIGGIGLVAAAYPFVSSLEPSERAR